MPATSGGETFSIRIMSGDRSAERPGIPADFPAAPLTLEGFSILHQMFRVRRNDWRALDAAAQKTVAADASAKFEELARREDGESAVFNLLGHKGDLIVVHFRRSFDELASAESEVAGLKLADYLEPTTSYLSVIEIGLYEATVALYQRLAQAGITSRSADWKTEIDAEISRQRQKISPRLYPRIPDRPYLCFYPMDKKRDGADNWYRLPIDTRQRLMHEHGMVGRRFAGEVTQIISGSIGFDDWEWGVDLFADDPLVFKKLVYEMRFDEASASYAKFGQFYFAIRLAPADLSRMFAA
ncbi:MAG: Chlorite dismutase [Candidatus Binatus sp.]|nr:Chlorite dismutase [Candidatus Binatus sp.]